jgi:hypothetical protein
MNKFQLHAKHDSQRQCSMKVKLKGTFIYCSIYRIFKKLKRDELYLGDYIMKKIKETIIKVRKKSPLIELLAFCVLEVACCEVGGDHPKGHRLMDTSKSANLTGLCFSRRQL